MIDQIGIFGFGIAAVFLTNIKNPQGRRWAALCGLAAEPFWFYTGIINNQWGVVALAFVYSYAWGMGVYNFWIKPYYERKHLLQSTRNEIRVGDDQHPPDGGHRDDGNETERPGDHDRSGAVRPA